MFVKVYLTIVLICTNGVYFDFDFKSDLIFINYLFHVVFDDYKRCRFHSSAITIANRVFRKCTQLFRLCRFSMAQKRMFDFCGDAVLYANYHVITGVKIF